MKKKIILMTLLSTSLVSLTLVSVFAGKNSKSFDSLVRASETTGRHYPGIEATETTPGLREYWTNCNGMTNLSKPDYADDCREMETKDSQEVLEDLLANNPSDTRIINAHEHYDFGGDFICDVPGCNFELEGVESITVTCPLTFIGNKESVLMTANVVTHGSVTDGVTWSISDTTNFTITDMKDGTAKVTSKYSSSSNSKTATVTAKSKYNTSITGTCQIKSWNYSDSRIKGVDEVAGKNNRPPYFLVSPASFVSNGDKTVATASNTLTGNTTVYNQSIAAFRNAGTYSETVVEDKTYFSKDSVDDEGKTVEFCIYQTATTTEIECRLLAKTFNSFPTTLVNEFISGLGYETTSDVIIPETATNYTYYKKSSVFKVFVQGGNFDEYLSQLGAQNYYVIEDDYSVGTYYAVSPERTLVLELKDYSTYFEMRFSTQSAPSGATEWSTTAKNLMNSYIGEVLPFVDAGYGTWSDQSSTYNYISTSSSRKEAYPLTLAVFEADSSFTKESESTNSAVFTKNIDEKHQIKVSITNGAIRVEMIVKAETEWLATEIAEALGSYAKEALPAATGTGYYYQFDASNNSVEIKVIGDLDTYVGVLSNAGYDLEDYGWYGVQGVSSTGTISVIVDYDGYNYDAFVISANAHLPKGTTETFPTSDVKKALGLKETDSLPTAEGTLFVFEKGEGKSCSVIVTGNKTSFLESLTDFLESDGVYSNEEANIKLSVEDVGEGMFKITFALIVESAEAVWPDDAQAIVNEFVGYYNTPDIPCPTTSSSISTSGFYVNIAGGNLDEYLSQLESVGYTIDKTYYASYSEIYVRNNGNSFQINVIDSSTFSLYLW